MTKAQLDKAVAMARVGDVDSDSLEIFNGFGLCEFHPITCTLRALAALVRWQCFQLNGEIDCAALNEIRTAGRAKFMVCD